GEDPPGCGSGGLRGSLIRPSSPPPRVARRQRRSSVSQRSVFKARRVANETASGWLPDHSVVVEGERIAAVLPAARLPGDAAETSRIPDLGDVSLLPGLVDCHSHLHCSATPDAYHLVTSESHERLLLRAAANARAALLSGVTTLRDIGSRNEVAF